MNAKHAVLDMRILSRKGWKDDCVKSAAWSGAPLATAKPNVKGRDHKLRQLALAAVLTTPSFSKHPRVSRESVRGALNEC